MNHFLYQINYFDPLLKALESSGISIQRLHRISELKNFDINKTDGYVPALCLYSFLEEVAKELGTSNLGMVFYDQFALKNLGDYGLFLANRPVLHSLLEDSITFETVLHTNSLMNLYIEGPEALFTLKLADQISPGRKIAEEMGFSMVCNAILPILGDTSSEIQIHIPHYFEEKHLGQIPFRNFVLRTTKNEFGIGFPTDLLNLVVSSKPTKNQLSLPPDRISEKLALTLKNLKDGRVPTLGEMATYFETSERSMKRQLQRESTTYSKVVNTFLMLKGIQLLKNTTSPILEISDRLGYSNPSNFIRAFRKWTGTTPAVYRDKLA
jgi:AraC-like DNA-binding protein